MKKPYIAMIFAAFAFVAFFNMCFSVNWWLKIENACFGVALIIAGIVLQIKWNKK